MHINQFLLTSNW